MLGQSAGINMKVIEVLFIGQTGYAIRKSMFEEAASHADMASYLSDNAVVM
jgi:hypothetical protein